MINELFGKKRNGFFVEIGCLDGIEYSNTYFFEKKGWNGICVEAHHDFIEMLKKNRPGSSIVHCAVGEKNEDHVTFYANAIGSLSTLDKSEEERWNKSYKEFFTGFEEQDVKMRTLTTIFDELKVAEIDFVSLDIEGYEVQALSGLDFSKYKPRVFVIEYKDDEHKNKLENILFPNGYSFMRQLDCNLFYSTEPADKKLLTKNYKKIHLIIPAKDGTETIREVSINMPTTTEIIRGKLSKVKRIVKNKLKK